jgi:hypothetical protein
LNEEESHNPDSLSAEDIAAINALSEGDIQKIDDWLFSCTDGQWKKVAMVVARAISISDEKGEFLEVPDTFFGMRIESLVAAGKLVSSGNLKRMRFSEVKRARSGVVSKPNSLLQVSLFGRWTRQQRRAP